MDEDIDMFVGIDLGAQAHRICVLDRERKVLAEWTVQHAGENIAAAIERLLDLAEGRSSRLGLAVESRWSSIIEALLERGIRAFSINPKQLDRFRDRHTTAGAKDDRRDAFVLADSLRTDAAAFREIRLGDARLVELRELSRMHEDLTGEHIALTNRLHQQLLRIFPQILELGSIYNESWILALLKRAPTPEQLPSLSLAKIRTVLGSHRIKRWSPEQVRDVLRKPPLVVAPGVTTAARKQIQMLLPRLALVHAQMHETREAMEKLLEDLQQPTDDPEIKQHRDVAIILSLPGVGTIVGATMLGEAHEALAQRDYHRLRTTAGTAPVTRQSGKSRLVVMRHACNERLRHMLFHMARTLIQHDPKAKALYASHRARGRRAAHALRIVADRALAMLVRMLEDGVEYDPSKRACVSAN